MVVTIKTIDGAGTRERNLTLCSPRPVDVALVAQWQCIGPSGHESAYVYSSGGRLLASCQRGAAAVALPGV